MKLELDFLHVQGERIVNARDEVVHLRGLCLGGWMSLENFLFSRRQFLFAAIRLARPAV